MSECRVDEPASRVLNIRVPTSLFEAVKAAAKQDDRTMSGYIRHVLREATGRPR